MTRVLDVEKRREKVLLGGVYPVPSWRSMNDPFVLIKDVLRFEEVQDSKSKKEIPKEIPVKRVLVVIDDEGCVVVASQMHG